MGAQLTVREGGALYGLLAGSGRDIVFKTDRDGFVRHATAGLEELGHRLSAMLVGPHIGELAEPGHGAPVVAAHRAAIAGEAPEPWIEFPARHFEGCRQWFALTLRALRGDGGRAYGTIGVLRCVDERRVLEEELFAATITDEVTGLTNRKAFLSMLGHLVDKRSAGCVALFDIDRFDALTIRGGPSYGDKVLAVFGQFLRSALRSEDIISRIGSARFAVLMTRSPQREAEQRCRELLAALGEAAAEVRQGFEPVTASAGVARIGHSLEGTMKRAELALFHAIARGRNQAATGERARFERVSGLGW